MGMFTYRNPSSCPYDLLYVRLNHKKEQNKNKPPFLKVRESNTRNFIWFNLICSIESFEKSIK